MSNTDLNLAMRISADVSRLLGGLAKGEGGMRKFGNVVKGELSAFKGAMSSVEGRLAQLGIGISAVATAVQSAHLDKDLKQLQLTAGATADEAKRLRLELLGAQVRTGSAADELKGGVDALIAGGLSMAEATATVAPMADTLAVAKTNADALAKAMGVASKQFDIDLSNTDDARLLLDKMVVAGRAGNAELENLPDIFARIGSSAKSSSMGIDQTLALVEALSLVEPSAERLATLTDSTLRVFTNARYMKEASKATGVKFFDADGSRRDAFKVLADIKGKYDKLGTEREQFSFINKAFGKADLDTQRGLKTLLDGDSLGRLGEIYTEVSEAGGTIAKDLPDAISNAVDQSSRLKGVLREAADGFAQPINDAVSEAIKFGLDSKANGGLGLDGTDIMLGGVLGTAGVLGAARYGGKAIKGLAGKFGGVGVGVATGKLLEEAAGVTPVYVVNMDAGFGGGLGTAEKLAGTAADVFNPKVFSKLKTTIGLLGATSLEAIPAFGALATAGSAAAVVLAGLAGYAVGTVANEGIDMGLSALAGRDTSLGSLLYDAINGEDDEQTDAASTLGRGAAWMLNPFQAASNALGAHLAERFSGAAEPQEVGGTIKIAIDSTGQPKVTQLQQLGTVDLAVMTGRMRAGQ
ncbi:phage tail tape measure protein [Aquipseudomonas campi]